MDPEREVGLFFFVLFFLKGPTHAKWKTKIKATRNDEMIVQRIENQNKNAKQLNRRAFLDFFIIIIIFFGLLKYNLGFFSFLFLHSIASSAYKNCVSSPFFCGFFLLKMRKQVGVAGARGAELDAGGVAGDAD